MGKFIIAQQYIHLFIDIVDAKLINTTKPNLFVRASDERQ